MGRIFLEHFLNQLIDIFLSISKISTFNKMICNLSPTTSSTRHFYWKQPIIGLLEILSNCVNLVNKILDACNSKVSKTSLNYRVVTQFHSLSVDVSGTAFVDDFADGFDSWVAPGDKRISN